MDVLRATRGPRFEFLLGTAPAHRSSGAAAVMWRITAANSRPIGQSWTSLDDLDSCIEAARAARRNVDRMQAVFVVDRVRGTWNWRSSVEDPLGSATPTPVAISAHPYARRVECLRGMNQFLDALRRADPADGVVRNLGSRGLRSYSTQPDRKS